MIRIQRSSKPQILEENGEQWTEELVNEFKATGTIPKNSTNRYGHTEIRKTLRDDSQKKCMYCESKISHISYPNVEHIAPKSKYPQKTFQWDNLGLACQVCNNTKRAKYDEQLIPVNPYEEEPSEHLFAFGEFLKPKPGSDRGKWTIKEVELNRPELIEKRGRRLKTIQSLGENYARAKNPKIKAMFLQELCIEIERDREYVLFGRALINGMDINCNEN